MSRILPWLFVPLAMAVCFFAIVCLSFGVDLSIERDGDRAIVTATNFYSHCLRFESNSNLTDDWQHYATITTARAMRRCFVFVPVDEPQRVFWRARECAASE